MVCAPSNASNIYLIASPNNVVTAANTLCLSTILSSGVFHILLIKAFIIYYAAIKHLHLAATIDCSTKRYLIGDFDTVLSQGLLTEAEESGVDAELEAYIAQKIAERAAAKQAKNYAAADAIRDELMQKGIILKDSREGTTWSLA